MTDSRSNDPRITLPTAPQPAARFRFPVVAATVPIVASLAIWLVTGSSFALIFAALGPLAATGSFIDSRVSARRKSRVERARFSTEMSATAAAIVAHHRREITELAERTPPAIELVGDVRTDSARWMRQPRDVLPVHLGYGRVRSDLSLERTGANEHVSASTEEYYQQLIEQAASLPRAPIAVNARLGIAIFGNQIMALSLARALAVQLARTLSPTSSWVRIRGAFSAEIWGAHLPHRHVPFLSEPDEVLSGHELACVQWGELGEAVPTASISVVSHEHQVPSGHRIVLCICSETVAVVGHPDRHQRRKFEPSFLGREQALAWAMAAREIAARDGLAVNDNALPESLTFRQLLDQFGDAPELSLRRSDSLDAQPAVGTSGRITIDLVHDGPHAIVGGTTGSGKSELLISWVLAMAVESSPDDVTFLLVDFKGGSAFAHLADLPHTVGIITDLDEKAASRAFASLRAELRYRERAIAQAGAKDISELDTLPRLVIVVDEFAAMMADYPQLHALFSDIAARGRSLGVHLILCTQRPSGIVRDALLANADLRISLRVNNAADSSAVIGSDRAAELPAQLKGRAWVTNGSSQARVVQFALASSGDVQAVASRWPGEFEPRRPWCEPLPERILLTAVMESTSALMGWDPNANDEGTVNFGISDLPDEQRHGVANWSPGKEGHLLVLGGPGSGKSTTITTITAAIRADESARRNVTVSAHVPAGAPAALHAEVAVHAWGIEPASFWDALSALHETLDHGEVPEPHSRCTIVTIDDLDAVIARFDDDYRSAVLDMLVRLLREGPAHNVWIVASAQRITPAIQAIAQLMPSTLRLRFASRQDFVLSGGVSSDFLPTLPAGGGIWKDARVQIGVTDASPPRPIPALVHTLGVNESVVVASSRPASAAATFTAAGWEVRTIGGAVGAESELLISDSQRPTALIGSIDEWQSRWGAINLLKAHATILLDGCSLSDYRQLTRKRELPPPITAGAHHYWGVTNDSGVNRVGLPETSSVQQQDLTE